MLPNPRNVGYTGEVGGSEEAFHPTFQKIHDIAASHLIY